MNVTESADDRALPRARGRSRLGRVERARPGRPACRSPPGAAALTPWRGGGGRYKFEGESEELGEEWQWHGGLIIGKARWPGYATVRFDDGETLAVEVRPALRDCNSNEVAVMGC